MMETYKPCWHMPLFLNGYCDSSIPAILRRYVDYHVNHCPRCAAALKTLYTLREKLLQLGRTESNSALSRAQFGGRRDVITALFDQVDDGRRIS